MIYFKQENNRENNRENKTELKKKDSVKVDLMQ